MRCSCPLLRLTYNASTDCRLVTKMITSPMSEKARDLRRGRTHKCTHTTCAHCTRTTPYNTHVDDRHEGTTSAAGVPVYLFVGWWCWCYWIRTLICARECAADNDDVNTRQGWRLSSSSLSSLRLRDAPRAAKAIDRHWRHHIHTLSPEPELKDQSPSPYVFVAIVCTRFDNSPSTFTIVYIDFVCTKKIKFNATLDIYAYYILVYCMYSRIMSRNGERAQSVTGGALMASRGRSECPQWHCAARGYYNALQVRTRASANNQN